MKLEWTVSSFFYLVSNSFWSFSKFSINNDFMKNGKFELTNFFLIIIPFVNIII